MKRVFGLAAIVAGAVLAIFLPDLEFGWFEGRPLGIVLVVIGGIEILESSRGRKPKGIVEELRDDFGLGSRRRDQDRHRDDRDRDRHRDDRDRDRYRDDRYRDDRDRDRYRDDRDRDRHPDEDRDRYRDRGREYDRDRGPRDDRGYPDV